jgi:hypothetical protein
MAQKGASQKGQRKRPAHKAGARDHTYARHKKGGRLSRTAHWARSIAHPRGMMLRTEPIGNSIALTGFPVKGEKTWCVLRNYALI